MSNNQLLSVPFQREERYVVIKVSKMHPHPTFRARHLSALKSEHEDALVDCVVVERDWPEYDPTWAAIEARVTGRPAAQPQAVPELTEDLREILGRPNFTCHFIAKALRVMGHSIAHKSEDEQAVVIHWLLGIYLKHGPDWRQRAAAELEEASQSLNT